ncbi:MAG: DNA repair protein RecO [Rickettsiales bacterium]|jgi:DNA repair protein RecO (recombination protein O)|nr:DNA repair protein RecO [Rickettsiales bacterium]
MKLESIGILIERREFGERDLIASFFTRDFGVLTGMLRGGAVARDKKLVGQFGAVSWNARLDSDLGSIHFEPQKNLIAAAMADFDKLKYFSAMFGILKSFLPERESYPELFAQTVNFLDCGDYLQWELVLMRELGYSLDTAKCAGCGCADNLEFLSPKTGRAVCGDCAGAWAPQMHKLPLNLEITKKFLNKIADVQGIKLPTARDIL